MVASNLLISEMLMIFQEFPSTFGLHKRLNFEART